MDELRSIMAHYQFSEDEIAKVTMLDGAKFGKVVAEMNSMHSRMETKLQALIKAERLRTLDEVQGLLIDETVTETESMDIGGNLSYEDDEDAVVERNALRDDLRTAITRLRGE